MPLLPPPPLIGPPPPPSGPNSDLTVILESSQIDAQFREFERHGLALEQLTRDLYLQEFESSFRGLEELETDWNGYDSAPPSSLSLQRAQGFLNALAAMRFRPTRIVPSAEGGVAVIFSDGRRYGDVEFFNRGAIVGATYTGRNEPDIWELGPTDMSYLEGAGRIREFFSQDTT